MVVGVELAEHRRIVMGADKGYVAAGSAGIPPGSPLAIEVEVLSVG
jgi:FKBP-type peptidyl-prolyl cis-trans isomerase